jgi:tetratricopeptide (TPR) repeat protein
MLFGISCNYEYIKYNQKGIYNYNNGNIAKAISYYDKALHIEPKSYNILFNKAKALFMLNEYDDVIKIINYLLQANPKDMEAIYYKSIIFLRKGKQNEAMLLLKNFFL